jgi:putative ATP-dependent endonuclease of OLD family
LSLNETPTLPAWAEDHDDEVVLIEHSHPTLEPQLTPGNEELVSAALEDINITAQDPVTAKAVHELFRSRRKLPDGTHTPAGPAARHKGEFAMALAGQLRDARDDDGRDVHVPEPLQRIFTFLYKDLQQATPTDDAELMPERAGMA